jgi:hypothetical protein
MHILGVPSVFTNLASVFSGSDGHAADVVHLCNLDRLVLQLILNRVSRNHTGTVKEGKTISKLLIQIAWPRSLSNAKGTAPNRIRAIGKPIQTHRTET